MEADSDRMGVGRAALLAVVAGVFLAAAEPAAALFVVGASGVAPGCDSCSNDVSLGSALTVLIVAAVVVWLVLARVVALCLGRHAARLGRLRILGCSLLAVPLPPAGILLGSRAGLSGRPSWAVPVGVALALGVGWVALVRWATNRRCRRMP